MARQLSEAHKKKLAAGRMAAAKKSQEIEDHNAKKWMAWCKEDARLYAERRQMVDFFGEESREGKRTIKAYLVHHRSQPPVPNDAAMRRVRGEA